MIAIARWPHQVDVSLALQSHYLLLAPLPTSPRSPPRVPHRLAPSSAARDPAPSQVPAQHINISTTRILSEATFFRTYRQSDEEGEPRRDRGEGEHRFDRDRV